MAREPVTVEAVEALPARLRFRVLAEGKPAKGAIVEFRLLDPFLDVPEEVRREVERVKREQGRVVWYVHEVEVGEEGLVDVVLPAGFYGVFIWIEERLGAGFGILLVGGMELPAINLPSKEPVDLGVHYPDFGGEEVRELEKGVKMVLVKTPTARLQFKVEAGGEPARGAVATFKLLEPYFDVPEKLKRIMGVSEKSPYVVWSERRVETRGDGRIDVQLSLGLYGVVVSKPGYRIALYGVALGGDMELSPIRLKRGRGKPVEIGIFFYTGVVVEGKGEEGG